MTHHKALSLLQSYTPSLSGSVCVSVWVCTCVYDKPHWWSNSRLAVFPDWVVLDMHTSKALQVDVLALQRCNSLAWLTQYTLETGKQNPNSAQCYIRTTGEKLNHIYCTVTAMCVCVCPSACMRGCVCIICVCLGVCLSRTHWPFTYHITICII